MKFGKGCDTELLRIAKLHLGRLASVVLVLGLPGCVVYKFKFKTHCFTSSRAYLDMEMI